MRARLARGFQLPELMISLVVGLFLVAAFLAALRQSRELFATNENVAWLQDAARHASSVLVPDIEHAGFYGFAGSGVRIGSLPAGIDACGPDFATTLVRPVQASDDVWPDLGARCVPTASAGGARDATDVLTVRRASFASAAPNAGRLQVYSRRLASQAPIDLFADGVAPGAIDGDAEVRDLEVRTYYIANDSVDRPGFPALRVKALTESGGAAQFRDEEIVPGVEDLQVELGVVDGARVSYVPPASPLAPTAEIFAVRFWLRIRAESSEPGFSDAQPLSYAGRTFVPTPAEARFRRLLLERSVALRNAR
jgi:type IV pilus assembly protein PilW